MLVQTSLVEASGTGVKRQVGPYGLWKFGAASQLRLAVNKLLAEEYVTVRYLTAPNGTPPTRVHNGATVGLRLETKL